MGQCVRWFLGLRPTVKTGPIDPRSAPLLLYSSPDELSDTWPARRRTFPPSSDRSCSARLIDEGSRREPYALVVEMPNQRKRGQGDACAQYQNHQVLAFAVRSFRKLSPVHGSLLKLPPPRYLLLSRLTRVQLSCVQADPRPGEDQPVLTTSGWLRRRISNSGPVRFLKRQPIEKIL